MSLTTFSANQHSICEIRVAAADHKGARFMACLLADVGQQQGLLPLSIHSDAQEEEGKPMGPPCITVRFAGDRAGSMEILAVLDNGLKKKPERGLVLVNSRKAQPESGLKSLDADGIASSLGVPVYLPMLGGVARLAGWSDLNQVKSAVGMALRGAAPQWLAPGLQAVEAGYNSVA